MVIYDQSAGSGLSLSTFVVIKSCLRFDARSVYCVYILQSQGSSEPIDSFDKALALPNVGRSLAEKIAEIAESGSLEKLEVLQSSDSLRAVQLFMRIWGVGPETANVWANQVIMVLRTIDQLTQFKFFVSSKSHLKRIIH